MKEQKKIFKKEERGITLIALVITIIVLLILAGVSIAMLTGDNGILTQAQRAKNETEAAAANEAATLDEYNNVLNNWINGGTAEPEDEWDLSKVDKVESADETPVIVPVPKGYTASKATGENTVEDGFVIYEGENEVTDSNKEEAQITRNQFVWVPVANVDEMYGTDSTGKKWGKTYEFYESGIREYYAWEEQNGIMIIDPDDSREPDVATDYDSNNNNLQEAGLDSNATVDTFKLQMETDFNNMIASVGKYGGFYIGRYETGNTSQSEAVVVKNNTDIKSGTWYTHYKLGKDIAANNNVSTTMVFASQWDAVMKWMYNSGNEEKKKYTYDSTGKGNYRDTNGNEIIPTGSNPAYGVNNIYDMAGNVWEWTLQVFGSHTRLIRGGYYACLGYPAIGGNGSPASGWHSDTPTSGGSFGGDGSRIALYIN